MKRKDKENFKADLERKIAEDMKRKNLRFSLSILKGIYYN